MIPRARILIAALMLGAPAVAAPGTRMEVRLACGSMTGVGHIIVLVDGTPSAPIRLDCGKGV